MSKTVFVHVTEPGFRAGGGEIRSRKLFEAVERLMPSTTLAMIPGIGSAPWASTRLRAAASGIPPRLSRLYDRAARDNVGSLVAGADLTVAETTLTAALINPSERGRIILDAHNIEARVAAQLAKSSDGALRRCAYSATTAWTRSYERRLARSVAGVWAVSAEEGEWFSALGARVWLVPNGVAIPQDPPAFSGDHKLLFVGSLNSLFNRQGLEWFLTEIWPHIRSRIPDSRFMLAGAGPKMSLPDGVAQLGFVEDLEPLYEQARVCIAPLHGGAGTRLKILEAMAHSRPVVTTTVGAEGISVSENDGVFIRDDAQAFARTCGELLTDDAASKDSGRNARERSAEFSWERIAQVAVESIKEVSRS